jgi:ABC-type multidrug transport system ATPase subunit
MKNNLLSVKSITKRYGPKTALDAFSMEFEPGVYGLLGPNGAGKTTLMRIIAGNLLPDTGQVFYNGEDTLQMGSRFKEVLGYMPQQQNLYDHFSARRFLRYMAALKGLNRRYAMSLIEELLVLVGLQNDAHRNLGEFSGGMKQRVLIAQTLLNDPKVLLMDEPTAGLDPKERINIRNFISEIAFEKIVLLATHVVSDIENISKEVILLNKGKIITHGEPSAIIGKMQGKVYEISATIHELPKLQKLYRIRNLVKYGDTIVAQIVTDVPPRGNVREIHPSLEDAYLYFSGE